MSIQNMTPYVGKLKLRFEKYPEYSGGNPWSKLNKVHFDLGFTKLVSRMYPNRKKDDGLEIKPSIKQLAPTYSGGKIDKYEWWECKSKKTGKHKTLTKSPNPDIYEILHHFTLPNSFLTNDGIYMGDIENCYWYYQNQMRISERYPGQVGIKYNKKSYSNQFISFGKLFESDIIGYYGYSHRGGSLFKIGDRIFDEKYEPNEEDYEPWEWAGYVQEYEKGLKDAKKRKDDFDIKDIELDGVSRYIPFAKRGKQIIKTWEDAELAAYNLSKYLS